MNNKVEKKPPKNHQACLFVLFLNLKKAIFEIGELSHGGYTGKFFEFLSL